MRNFVIRADANGDFQSVFVTPPDYVNAKALAASTAESETVPALAGKVRFNCTADFYVKIGGTATVPGDTTDGSASELNPDGYSVVPGQVISVISASNCIITFSYYR